MTRKRLVWIAAGILILTAFWLAGFSVGRSPSVQVTASSPAEVTIQEHASKFLGRGHSLGMVVVAIVGDREYIVPMGVGALGSGAKITPESNFEIGSITKVFTGIALAHEIEAGRVKLDDPVSKHLPPGVELSPAAKDITIRQLTTHASGLPRLPEGINFFRILPLILFGSDPYSGYSLDNFKSALRQVKLESKPGEKLSYSNFGVALLGWMLAQKQHVDFGEYMRERIFSPLGMTNSTLESRNLVQGHRSVRRLGPVSYALKSSPWSLADHLTAAGGIRSNGADMLKFLRANMRAKTGPIRESHRELFKGEDVAIGMNWLRSGKPESPLIWHNGGTGGFCSYMAFREDGSKGIVVLSNTSDSVDDFGFHLLEALK